MIDNCDDSEQSHLMQQDNEMDESNPMPHSKESPYENILSIIGNYFRSKLLNDYIPFFNTSSL
jgi:hypothetical protein